MATGTNRQILLVETPKGKLMPQNFSLSNGSIPTPKDGDILVKVKLISLDAANRAWMQGATYRSAVEAGTVMAGGSISEVIESKAPGFEPGDLVYVESRISNSSYERDGEQVYTTDVIAQLFNLLSKKPS